MKVHHRIPLILILLAALALACSFNFSSANINEAYLASDSEGQQRTTTFDQADTFYAIVDLANAPDDTVVLARWFAVNADGVEPEFLIDEVSYTSPDAIITFHLTNDQFWPTGQYRVDLYLNSELDRSLEFEVR